ncbi:penicillin-binding transpeptidase domain-containing protein [Paenibacillus sp. OV219]|uniref:penicillin-binding transpeptidase domain-containing protein n=1 Tax=Paenibacillus sp. OV219 TaxID=1884377 RepID=UPI0008D76F51|nr:penicillin-binding transpeptidase domain-containing protein [Paenibacillus sp. OV219]SEN11672.1 penicillin-binding protein 2B [Paenibacillus sp. OV219]
MTKRIKLRTLLIGGFITLLFVSLVGRIYWVQVVKADFWAEKAREVWSRSETLVPVRGEITDRNGNVLAMDVSAYTIALNPQVIHTLKLEDVIVSKLNVVLGKTKSSLNELLDEKQKNGEYYKQREVRKEGWKIDKSVADRIVKFREDLKKQTGQKDVGIYLIDQKKRFYPKGDLAAHVIGYEDKDGNAIMGLEASLNKELSGVEGHIKYERDGNGVILDNGTVSFTPSVDGKNVKLTIDTDIQHYIEDALKETYEKYKPKSITAIAADPQTMEILGMANMPDFNPNSYWTAPQENFYDHSIKSLYEPGSTFKIVTLSGTVQEGMFNPNETYKSGKIKLPGGQIHDIERNGWGTISFLEGLKRSSNVAFVKLGYERLKADKLMDYILKFGFNQKTGIELPGEIKGDISFNPSYPTEVATAAFGQGRVQVTPIQQVAAVAAVANGGKLLVPHLVKEIEDPVTKKVQVVKPQVVRQVISEKTANQVDEYLEQVVSDQKIGTGRRAFIDGYRVAGKTGTAQKVINGKYSEDKYVISFIGFAPVGDPKIVLYLVMDEPNDRMASGGVVMAPLFKQIVSQSLRHMGVDPVTPITTTSDGAENKEQTVEVPDVQKVSVKEATDKLKAKQLDYETVGKGQTVLKQIPSAGTPVSPEQRIYLLTEDRSKLPVPNMIGLSLRDALEMCSVLQIKCVTTGEGFVTSQTLVNQKGVKQLKLTLSPPKEQIEQQSASDEADDNATDGAGDNNSE